MSRRQVSCFSNNTDVRRVRDGTYHRGGRPRATVGNRQCGRPQFFNGRPSNGAEVAAKGRRPDNATKLGYRVAHVRTVEQTLGVRQTVDTVRRLKV